jgi:hypothetical protein
LAATTSIITVFAAEQTALAQNQNYSVDGVVVFEKNTDIYYSFYGHTANTPAGGQDARIPTPVNHQLTWSWWSIGAGGASNTGTKTRALTNLTNTFKPRQARRSSHENKLG